MKGFEWRSYSFAVVTTIILFNSTFREWYREASGFAEHFIYLPLGVLFISLFTWTWGMVFGILFQYDKEAKERSEGC